MKFQFQLRSLILFVVWIALGLFINFQARQTYWYFSTGRGIVSISYGQGWPLEYKDLSVKDYSATRITTNQWKRDTSPISESEVSGEIFLVAVLIDVIVWLGFYAILYAIVSLVSSRWRKQSNPTTSGQNIPTGGS